MTMVVRQCLIVYIGINIDSNNRMAKFVRQVFVLNPLCLTSTSDSANNAFKNRKRWWLITVLGWITCAKDKIRFALVCFIEIWKNVF